MRVLLFHALAFILALELVGDVSAQSSPAPTPAAHLDEERIRQIAAWLPTEPRGLGRPISDRSAWEQVAQRREWQNLVEDATRLLNVAPARPADAQYLEYFETGDRNAYDGAVRELATRLNQLVLAECVENEGRFVPAIEECVTILANLKTWCSPAHDIERRAFKGEEYNADLVASEIGWSLANTRFLLGESLSPEVRTLIKDQVTARILTPVRDEIEDALRQYSWLKRTNNWNAVCLANVTGAALATLEDSLDRALFVAAAEHYIQNFLSGFAADGYCGEGMSYWNFGFGHFVLLAETIHQATNGQIDLLADSRASAAAKYAWEIPLEPGVCPPFSDCALSAKPDAWIVDYLSRKLRMPLSAADAPASAPKGRLAVVLMTAFDDSSSRLPAPSTVDARLPARSWFEDAQVLIARRGERADCRLALAAKGGHNGESHNHNDLGSYVVTVDGVIVMVDPGSEVYTQRTFSDRRYESDACNSFGHPVPVAAGSLQRVGRNAQTRTVATSFADHRDSVTLDLVAAYDVPELNRLERTLTFDRRGEGSVTVVDAVEFDSPQSFETALVTLGAVEHVAPDRLRLVRDGVALEASIDAGGAEFAVVERELAANFRDPGRRMRIGIRLRDDVAEAAIKVTLTPR